MIKRSGMELPSRKAVALSSYTNRLVMMSQVGLGRVTVYRCHESVDWTALRTYASSGNDRRQNILDAYIQKHVDSGHRDNEYSILPVESTTDFLIMDVLLCVD